MSANNPLTFIASSTSISPNKDFMHGISRSVRSKCWISIDRLTSPAPTNILDFMLERYNKPNRQMTNVVKAAIAEAYNATVSDRDMVEGKMEKLTTKDIKLEWDQYCGCSCPCSPGYRVSFNEALYIRPEVRYAADIVVYLRPSLNEEPQPKTPEVKEHEMNIAILIDTLNRGGRPVKIQITKPVQVIKK